MGDNKLSLLLLLSIGIFTDAQDAPCLLAKRYRSFHKYEYLYEAESLNGLNGAINGPRASCKVEIEVPGTCQYVIHTRECTLSEVIATEADGSPVFRPAAGAETFKNEMEKNPLKVIVEGDNDIKLFPEENELTNILNIKRGIISALAVPVLEEERNKRMPTVFGLCQTEYTVNAREEIATDVTLTRDLSNCDNFRPIKDNTSPLALITGMHYPLAQQFTSKQTCNYKFDNQQKHMTSGTCTENHLFEPFSHKETRGITNIGKQKVSLLGVTEHNERVFDHNENMKPLHLDTSVDMSPNQDANAILTILRELAGLSQTTHGHKRAHLAQRLVSVIRKSNAVTLSDALPEALRISRSLTYQALFQCGTSECIRVTLQILRTVKSTTAEIDAAVYAMGLVPNPSGVLVKEMLEMAKFKPSKLIYYATSNAVRRLYKVEGKVTPEIEAVAAYVTDEIGDCTGDQEHVYLTLRVIGNMAAAMGAASPNLRSAVIRCISEPAASLEVQQAAIQVFRQTPVPEKGRSELSRVLLDGDAPVQKRIAAYLILMKDPQPAELDQLVAALPKETNLQAKSFFISHITNILSSTAPETSELRQKILDALQGNEVEKVMDPTKFSRHYKMGSLAGNMIFEKANELPKEVMLEMTLNAFGFDIDMFEVGVEAKGLEPTVEALFGPSGFFPDTVMKTIYFAADKMPSQVNNILRNFIPALRNDRKKRQASQNIIKEITQNIEKLIQDLKAQDTPEAMLYLRLLGAELGYLKTKDMEELAYSVARVAESLMKMFPADVIKGLFSSVDNELFLHYIFMDNEFYLPTGPGVPLRVAMSGTFAPGVKGGLKIARDMSEIAFMPAVGVEFVTEIGAHLPDYVQSGLEMHTNIYHESGLNAKVTMTGSQIKLSIPAPESSKLLSITNTLLSVAGDDIKTVPAMEQVVSTDECSPLFPGLMHCRVIHFSDARLNDASPYFPLSGNSKFELELRPTGEVSEYSATIKYEYEEMVDTVTVDVKAEGTPTEATFMVKLNRQDYTVSADLQIPEHLNVGFKIDTAGTKTKGERSIMIDILSNNVPQASLIGLAKIEALKEATVQVQLLVPSLQTDAKMTVNLKRAEDLIMELKSDIRIPETTSEQKLVLKYGDQRIEAEIKSDVSAETNNIVPEIKAQISDILDQQIGQTEIKVRDVLTSSVEATNNYLEASKIPFVENVRLPLSLELDLPKTLFFNIDTRAEYHFGKDYYTISFPVPLGGKSSKDLNFPPALSTPSLAVPQFGLDIASVKVPLPEILIPDTITVSLPILGKTEVFGKFSSNLYDLEATASAGRELSEQQSYSAKVEVTGTSPVEILSLRAQGSALLSGTTSETLKAEISTAVIHKLIDARVNIVEEIQMAKDFSIKSSSKFEANSVLGDKASLEHTGQVESNIEGISGDHNLKGSFVTGPVHGDVSLTQSLSLFPFRPEARIQSLFKVDSAPVQAQNTFDATYANGELSVLSNTDAFEEKLTHTAEITFAQSRFAVKSDAKALALGLKIQNIAEASIGAKDVNIRFETTTDRSEDHIKSLITLALDVNGLDLKSNASVKLAAHTATHKASLTLNKNGLATSGATNLNSLLVLRNTFNGILDSTKASLKVNTRTGFVGVNLTNDISVSATASSVDLACKSQGAIAKYLRYKNDISVQAIPYSATVNVNNDLRILPLKINHEAVLKAEPYKADLTGSLKLAVDAEELKHTYEIRYADLAATAKCSTSGKLMGAHLSHDTEMEIAGLAVRIDNNANFNSQPLRFSTTLKATAAPFNFNLNALANGDGELNLYGKQSVQAYTKILLKAEPLAFAHSHECRVSTKHELTGDLTIETNFDNKVDTMLTPSEQSATVRVKSKINNNEISEDIVAYNNPQRIGLEVSGVFTNSEIQDVSLSGFLKYDKNTESHVINMPFMESLPVLLETIKNTAVTIAEELRNYVQTEDFVVKIQTLLQQVSDFLNDLDLEERAVQLKQILIALAQDYAITVENLEASLMRLRTVVQKAITELRARVSEVKDYIATGVPDVQKLIEKLNVHLEECDINGMLFAVIEVIEDVINFIAIFPTEDVHNTGTKVKQYITELDISGSCKVFYNNVKGILVKYEVDKKIEAFLDKIMDLIKQFKIDQTVQVLVNTLKSVQISFVNMLDKAITYLKTTEIKDIIEDLNTYLDAFIQQMKSFDYNAFVDEANQKITEYTTQINNLIVTLELPKKLEAVREFINYALSSVSAFFEKLRTVKVTDAIKTLKDIVDNVALNDIKAFAETIKQKILDMDLRGRILQVLEYVSDVYTKVLTVVTDAVNGICEMAQNALADQPIVTELKQIIEGIITALKTVELESPSFTVPLTDLVLPSMKISLHQLQEIDLPTQFEIPQFTILGLHTVPATIISFEDIKQRLIALIDFIVNFDIEMLTNDSYFGELSVNFLPDFSAITLPEITIPDFTFPAIPKLDDKFSLNIPLQIPQIKLPEIPTAVAVPAFGKLYSEIKLRTPIYTLRTSAEIQNSTDNEQMHHFTAFFTSMGMSAQYPVLNYNLDSTARIGVPRMSRLIIAETLKFIHSALTVEHQSSVTFYGLSAQATAQTTMKAITTPYKADIVNKAFFAVEGGMSASSETSYKHQVDIPFLALTSEAALTQSAVAVQKDTTISVTIGHVGTGKVTHSDNSDEFTYKSDLRYNMDLQNAKLTFTEDFDSDILKMKETLNVNAVYFSHIDFNGKIETKSPYIKNSLVVASGGAYLAEEKVELQVTHDTELVGPVSGTLSNALNVLVRLTEVVIDFQNRGNAKASLEKSLSAKMDLQNDYSVIVNAKKQRISTLALVRFNQYKYGHNLTFNNGETEAGIYAAVNGEADLDFLTVPLSIPEMTVPVFDFRTPAINDLNLYEHSGLKHLLTATKQAIDVDGKIVYQKSFIDLGFIRVPSFGNLNSDVSFKSSIFNLNANAGIHRDDDVVIHIAATTTSVHDPLKAKLEGTSRLSLKRGLKLANALSLENAHINGNHNSTMTLNPDNLEAAVAVSTLAKVDLRILTVDVTQNLKTGTKTQPNAVSNLNIKYTYDLPMIKADGKGDLEHAFKLDGDLSSISVESSTKVSVNGILLETGIGDGVLDHTAGVYMDSKGLRSNLKTNGNVHVKHADLTVQFGVDENLDLEAALTRLYTVLNVVSNNEVNIGALNTKGTHTAKATIDLDPTRSLTADIEFDLSQPSNFGDLTMYEKTTVDLTNRKISYSTKMASPVYTTNSAIEVEGNAPVFKVAFKSSAKSPVVLLGYELDSYISTAMENDVLSATAKAFFEHNDFTVDFNSVVASEPSHTLNMDITSPTFTDVNLRYVARRDGVTASVSTPSAGFLGFQLNCQIPSEMNTRLYGRYASAPENDIDIVNARVDAKGEKMYFLATYNMEAPNEMIQGLKSKFPAITSTIYNFGEKHGICGAVEELRTTTVSAFNKALTVASSHAPELSELSVLFRNVVVNYQKAIQNLLNAAARFLRETKIKLLDMEETTLPEICKKIQSNVILVIEQIITSISEAPIFKTLSTVQVTLPTGEVLTGDQIFERVKTQTLKSVKQLETIDIVLEKLGDTLKDVVEKAQEFVDNIRSDILDALTLYVNEIYTTFIVLGNKLIEKANDFLTIDQFNDIVKQCLESVLFILNELKDVVSEILPAESEALVKVQDGRLEIELPFPFRQ